MVDNYDLWSRHDADQEAEAERLPECSCCGEKIMDEHLYDIDGELYCEECLKERFKRATEDYIK